MPTPTNTSPSLGVVAIEEVTNSLFAIAASAIATFKDGLQLSDIKFMPEAVKHVIIIGNNIKDALEEAKDLDPEELGRVLGGFGAKLMWLLKEPEKLTK